LTLSRTLTYKNRFEYKLEEGVVNYILNALNRVQIAGVQQAKDLLAVTELLQNPTNKEELEKEQFEALKGKFEKKVK
jgi:hypothetical protein